MMWFTLSMVSVLLVDDQETFRAAGRAVVARIPDFEVVGEADSGECSVAMAAELVPDVVLMDINMGGIDGLEATRQIVEHRPETFVILVSTYTIDELPSHARTCGARAYVNKDELSPRRIRVLWEERDGMSPAPS